MRRGEGIAPGNVPEIALRECRGARGCRNALAGGPPLADELAALLSAAGFPVRATGEGGDAPHGHPALKCAIAWCPNGCSMPQIADIGIVAAAPPRVAPFDCTGCGACLAACAEGALLVEPGRDPVIARARCVECGLCARACPAGTLVAPLVRFRLLFGGRLGRHPRLAEETREPLDRAGMLAAVSRAAALFASSGVRRFADLLDLPGMRERILG